MTRSRRRMTWSSRIQYCSSLAWCTLSQNYCWCLWMEYAFSRDVLEDLQEDSAKRPLCGSNLSRRMIPPSREWQNISQKIVLLLWDCQDISWDCQDLSRKMMVLSQYCHDLSSKIGSFASFLELLSEDSAAFTRLTVFVTEDDGAFVRIPGSRDYQTMAL